MKFTRLLAAPLLAVLTGLGGAASAQANDNVYWSIGISSPGVQVGVANAPPVVLYPQMHHYPYPGVVVLPAPVLQVPRVVYGPAPGWQHGHHHGWGHGHEWRGHGGHPGKGRRHG